MPRAAHDGRRRPPPASADRMRPAHVGLAQRRRASGVTVPARTAAIASPTASNTGSPSPRCSTRSSHQRSGSGSPAAAASAASGSGGGSPAAGGDGAGSPRARTTASGRSMASTATPCSAAHAHRLPLRAELGERGEHGPLRAVDDVAEQGDRRDQPGVADPAERRAGVGRRLDEHDVGAERVERPAHRARRARPVVADAEQVQPPARAARRASAEVATGVVEVAPAVTVAHHPLQVLAPRHVVVQRVAHDGADDAAGEVARAAACRRRSGRRAPARW